MADFMRIGTFVYNLAHVRQIYKEAPTLDPGTGQQTNDPDTWNVLYEMGIDPQSGAGLVKGQVFTGEEGRAVEFWVTNNIPDVREVYQLSKNPRRKVLGKSVFGSYVTNPEGEDAPE
jgi:hypothetical protein